METVKNSLFEYEVVFLRVEHSGGYIEAANEEEAEKKIKDAAEKQNLIGFQIKSLKQSGIEIPDLSTSEDFEENVTIAKTSKMLN